MKERQPFGKRLEKKVSVIVGFARRIKEKARAKKEQRMMKMAFITPEEIKSWQMHVREADGLTQKFPSTAGVKPFQVFSKEEVLQLQQLGIAAKRDRKAYLDYANKNVEMTEIKSRIINCAIREPELVSIYFNEIMPEIGITQKSRQTAMKIIEECIEGGYKKFIDEFTGKNGIKFAVQFTKNGEHWDMKKIGRGES